jgi:hypothetical protein
MAWRAEDGHAAAAMEAQITALWDKAMPAGPYVFGPAVAVKNSREAENEPLDMVLRYRGFSTFLSSGR